MIKNKMLRKVIEIVLICIAWCFITSAYMLYRGIDVTFISENIDVIMISALIVMYVNFIQYAIAKETVK